MKAVHTYTQAQTHTHIVLTCPSLHAFHVALCTCNALSHVPVSQNFYRLNLGIAIECLVAQCVCALRNINAAIFVPSFLG
jgi:hypothetical protein